MCTHRSLQTVYMSSVWIERTACNPSRPFQLDPTLPSPPITSNSCFVPKLRFAVACLVIQTCLCPPLVIQTQLSLYLDAPSDGLALILPLFVCFATRLLCPVCLFPLVGFSAFLPLHFFISTNENLISTSFPQHSSPITQLHKCALHCVNILFIKAVAVFFIHLLELATSLKI